MNYSSSFDLSAISNYFNDGNVYNDWITYYNYIFFNWLHLQTYYLLYQVFLIILI